MQLFWSQDKVKGSPIIHIELQQLIISLSIINTQKATQEDRKLFDAAKMLLDGF